MTGNSPAKRRRVLKLTGSAFIGAVGLTGGASASQLRAYSISGDVYDSCEGSSPDTVPESSEGDVLDSCSGNRNNWYYVEWDDASPDGWAEETVDILLYQ